MKILRWKAILPLCLLLLLVAVLWVLLLDRMTARTVEIVGADLVGARVDVASADVNLAAGRVRILGLQAANPDSPMQNLVEVEEIVADFRVGALLRKKTVIEQLSVRGVRFGTERTTSGELENPSPESGLLYRRISGWADQVRIPPLSLEGLGEVVNVDAISADSLRTPALARATVTLADSSRGVWEENLNQLDPAPMIDSVRILVSRLNSANPLTLGLSGTRDLAGSARNTLTSVRDLEGNLARLDSVVRSGVGQLNSQVEQLAASREADVRYATSLLQLPSLDSPDVSPNLFGGLAVARMEPVLYWLGQAERFLPPGLNPRRFAGSERARMDGTTVEFPDGRGDPDFLIESADADLEIGGAGGAAGQYAATMTGLTTQPTVYGKPLRFSVARTAGAIGPSDVSVTALMDHVSGGIRDSLAARIQGVSLPSIDLDALGASLNMGGGTSELLLQRLDDNLEGSWKWSSSSVEWTRLGESGSETEDRGASGRVGQAAQDFLWRAVSSLEDVEIEVRFSGSVRGPALSIGSNVGRAVAQSLRQELGREIDRAEQQVRAEVDRLVASQVDEARGRVNGLQSDLESRIGVQLDELSTVRQELERAIRRLVPGG
jgi:uncharacterized protein (TIGR03545 family)